MSETNSIKDLIVEEDVNVNVGDSLLVGPDGPVGPEGPQGPEGKSAYEVAVENGFTGTEEEWLASLKAAIDDSKTATDTTWSSTKIDASERILNGNFQKVEGIDDMVDIKKVYVNTTDGNWYYYNGSNWIIGDEYQEMQIDKSNPVISDIYNNFDELRKVSSNLFDKTKAHDNASPNYSNNVTEITDEEAFRVDNNYCTTGVIYCEPGDIFTVSGLGYLTNFYGAIKTSDGTLVYNNIGIKRIETKTFSIPENVYAFRFRFTTNGPTNKNNFMIVKGDTLPDEYEPYGEITLSENVIVPSSPQLLIKAKNENLGNVNKATLVLLFDNTITYENSFNIMTSYMQQKNIPFTIFSDGSDSNEVISRAKLVKSLGGEMQFYNGQPAITYEGTSNYIEQYNQFKENYDRYLKMGIGKPKFVAYSGGRHTDITHDICKQFGFKLARTTDNSNFGGAARWSNDDLYNIGSFAYSEHTASSGSYCPVNSSDIYYKIIIPVLFHVLTIDNPDTSYNVTEETFKSMIDTWAKQRDDGIINIMNLSQIWEAIGFPKTAKHGQNFMRYEPIDNKQHMYTYTNDGWREITI